MLLTADTVISIILIALTGMSVAGVIKRKIRRKRMNNFFKLLHDSLDAETVKDAVEAIHKASVAWVKLCSADSSLYGSSKDALATTAMAVGMKWKISPKEMVDMLSVHFNK